MKLHFRSNLHKYDKTKSNTIQCALMSPITPSAAVSEDAKELERARKHCVCVWETKRWKLPLHIPGTSQKYAFFNSILKDHYIVPPILLPQMSPSQNTRSIDWSIRNKIETSGDRLFAEPVSRWERRVKPSDISRPSSPSIQRTKQKKKRLKGGFTWRIGLEI